MVVKISIIVNSAEETEYEFEPETTIREIYNFIQYEILKLQGNVKQTCFSVRRNMQLGLFSQVGKNRDTLIITMEPDAKNQQLIESILEPQNDDEILMTEHEGNLQQNNTNNFCQQHYEQQIQHICVSNHQCSQQRRLCGTCIQYNHKQIMRRDECRTKLEFIKEIQGKIKEYLQQIQDSDKFIKEMKQIKGKIMLLLQEYEKLIEGARELYIRTFDKIKQFSYLIRQQPICNFNNITLDDLVSFFFIGKELEKQGFINKVNYDTIQTNFKLFSNAASDFSEKMAKVKFETIPSSKCQIQLEANQKSICYNQLDLSKVTIDNAGYGKYLVNYIKEARVELFCEVICDSQSLNTGKQQFKDSLTLREIFEIISQREASGNQYISLNNIYQDWTCFSMNQTQFLQDQFQTLQWYQISNNDTLIINTVLKSLNIKFHIYNLDNSPTFAEMEEKFKPTDSFNFLIQTVMNKWKIKYIILNHTLRKWQFIILTHLGWQYQSDDESGKTQLKQVRNISNNSIVQGFVASKIRVLDSVYQQP